MEHRRSVVPFTVALIALILSVLALYFGYQRRPEKPDDPSQRTTTAVPGTLRVAVVPAPPISSIDPASKQPQGYAIDVINLIAKKGDLKVTFLPSDWATMGAALQSGKADVVVGPIFMTEGRARDFAFTESLFAYAVVAVVPAKNPGISTTADLQKPGLRVAVGRGGFDAEFVATTMPGANVAAFPPDDATLPMLELIAGRADVAFVDHGTATRFVNEHPETAIGLNGAPVSIQYAAFMLRHDQPELREFLNVALRNADFSGALESIDRKYATERNWYARVSHQPRLIR